MEHATHYGPRAQKTPPPGERPGILAEPGPQRSDRSRRPSSWDALPTLGLPVLAGASGEVVDSSALSFLTAQALETKSKEEEEEQEAKRRKTHAAEEAARLELRSLLAVPRSRRTAEHETRLNAVTQQLGAASKRKRKKRKERRLPRTSSSSRTARIWKSGRSSTRSFFWLMFGIFVLPGEYNFIRQSWRLFSKNFT